MKIILQNNVKKILLVFVLLISAWFIIHTIIITVDGLSDEIQQTDIAVVFGNTVELTGQPSNRLKARLDKALELYQKKLFSKIIVSGGFGKEGFQEAEVMKNYLIEKQVKSDVIIVDNEGNNTYLTAKNVKEIMQKNNFHSVMIISQYHHISRAKLTLKKLGIKNVYSAHANYFEIRDIYSTIREFFGFYRYVIVI